ncbi:hypothetical protein A0256_14005 [Mucilaginibacter sp. PAMC 26640]|nr:hypothetical protein A0256_14005 [Mucilaginibacter sp. PAMC 26640]
MLNQIINLFWTTLCFAVLGIYWSGYLAEQRSFLVLAVFVVFSIMTYAIPARWIDKLGMSKNKSTYERIGVKWLLYFVQNGILVNHLQKRLRRHPGLIHNREQAENYLKTIRMQERFHYCCFILFTLTTCSALLTEKLGMALLILLCNITFNVYPVLLQQYNRIRINRLLRGE